MQGDWSLGSGILIPQANYTAAPNSSRARSNRIHLGMRQYSTAEIQYLYTHVLRCGGPVKALWIACGVNARGCCRQKKGCVPKLLYPCGGH